MRHFRTIIVDWRPVILQLPGVMLPCVADPLPFLIVGEC
jgi:hypothetical protein